MEGVYTHNGCVELLRIMCNRRLSRAEEGRNQECLTGAAEQWLEERLSSVFSESSLHHLKLLPARCVPGQRAAGVPGLPAGPRDLPVSELPEPPNGTAIAHA
jgi:hypothetical protein